MYKNNRIAVVIPSYNEATQVGQVIASIPPYVDHIIAVDDCSTDETLTIIQRIKDERIRVVRTPVNRGVGGAMIAGYRDALELKSDVTAKMDGDGQMDPEQLHLLLDAIIDQGYDYAKGNRFLVGEFLYRMPRFRLMGNIVLTFVNKLASGYWNVFDPQNGYTVIRSEKLALVNLERLHNRYFFENDMLIALNFQNARVLDVAIPARYLDERSDLNPFKVGLTFPILFMFRFWQRIYQKYVLRDFSPIALFLFSGIVLVTWGTLFGAYHWILSIVTNHVASTGTVMVAVLPFILGFQLILQAIVLDIQQTPK
jgi:glycosyltransferase involved in cell wall biosynthesis